MVLRFRLGLAVTAVALVAACTTPNTGPAPATAASAPAVADARARARELVKRAQELDARKDFPAALQAVNEALALDPKLAEAWLWRGYIRNAAHESDANVVADYEKVVALEPGNFQGQFALALALQRSNRLSEARAAFNRAIALSPGDSDSYRYRAEVRRDLGDLPGALADASRAVALTPQRVAAYTVRAEIRRVMQDYPGAVGDAEHAMMLKPDDPYGYLTRGLVRSRQQDYAGASADYTQVILYAGTDTAIKARALRERSAALSANGDRRGAEADLIASIVLEPTWSAHFDRGRIRFERKEYRQALPDFEAAARLAKAKEDIAEALVWRGETKSALGDLAGAFADYDASLARHPLPIAYLFRGSLEVDKGDYQAGLRDLDRVIELAPAETSAYGWRAQAKTELGDLAGALSDVNIVLSREPNDGRALAVLRRLKQLQRAGANPRLSPQR